MKALPELSSLKIHPRGLRRGQRGPGPGQGGRGGPLRGASWGCQRGSALQEAILTAAWAAKGREGVPVRARDGKPRGEINPPRATGKRKGPREKRKRSCHPALVTGPRVVKYLLRQPKGRTLDAQVGPSWPPSLKSRRGVRPKSTPPSLLPPGQGPKISFVPQPESGIRARYTPSHGEHRAKAPGARVPGLRSLGLASQSASLLRARPEASSSNLSRHRSRQTPWPS